MNMLRGKRIIVLGCSGSGKSTFSRKLNKITGLPLYHLDNIWWNYDRTHISREDFDEKLDELFLKPEWIIDGNYSRTYEKRIRACDTIILLDYSEDTCLQGIVERIGVRRSDIPWVDEGLDPALVEMVRGYEQVERPGLLELLDQYPGKEKFIFKTRDEANEWLSNLAQEYGYQGELESIDALT